VLHHLTDEGIQTTSTPITTTDPRCGVLCSFADASTAQRAKDILRNLGADEPGAFKINLCIKHPSDQSSGGGARGRSRQPSMNFQNIQIRIPRKDSKYTWYHSDRPAQAGAGAAAAAAAAATFEAASGAAAAAAAAAEPVPPPPAEPAGSSQLARMGCHRHHASGPPSDNRPPSVNRPSSRHRDRETDCEPRRTTDNRGGSGSGSGGSRPSRPSRRPTLHAARVSQRELQDRLLALRPFASNCHLAAPRRRDGERPQSGSNEMYIFQQRGEACGVKNVGNLHFPQLLCDSLAGARILRGVAALLHIAFYKPDSSRVAKRLKRCYESLIPRELQRMLVDDCQAYAGRQYADVGRRGVEVYLMRVVLPMVARR
jgi:hypothetical protein